MKCFAYVQNLPRLIASPSIVISSAILRTKAPARRFPYQVVVQATHLITPIPSIFFALDVDSIHVASIALKRGALIVVPILVAHHESFVGASGRGSSGFGDEASVDAPFVDAGAAAKAVFVCVGWDDER